MLGNCKKLVIFGVLLIWVCSGSAASIQTLKPHLGTLQKSFTEPAKTHLENTYSINMPITGKLERISMREGDKVKKGEVVAMEGETV